MHHTEANHRGYRDQSVLMWHCNHRLLVQGAHERDRLGDGASAQSMVIYHFTTVFGRFAIQKGPSPDGNPVKDTSKVKPMPSGPAFAVTLPRIELEELLSSIAT